MMSRGIYTSLVFFSMGLLNMNGWDGIMQNHQITRIHHETISRPKKTSSGESPLLKLFIYITLPLLNPFILHWLLKHNFTPWILKHVHLNSTIHLKTHDYPYLNLRSNTFWHENTHLSWPKTLMTHLNPPWDFPPKTAPTVADRCRPLPTVARAQSTAFSCCASLMTLCFAEAAGKVAMRSAKSWKARCVLWKNHGKTMENHGKTMGIWKNPWKMLTFARFIVVLEWFLLVWCRENGVLSTF